MGNIQDECFYCATGQQHPVVTNDDDVTVKENWRRYSDSRYNAQGVLTRANSELDFLKWLGGDFVIAVVLEN